MGLEPASNMRVPLKYVSEDIDRHGNVRCYVRLPGRRRGHTPTPPGPPEFREGQRGRAPPTGNVPRREAAEEKNGSSLSPGTRYYQTAFYKPVNTSTPNWQQAEEATSQLQSHV